MKKSKLDIFVYAHWKPIKEPKLIGVLSALQAKGKKAFKFEYDKEWIKSENRILLDPDIHFFSGPQYPNNKENFGVFLDSMPDTWGKTLMKRRNAQLAHETKQKPKTLYEVDYLLGVYDASRMGGLRFKLDKEGKFLDDNDLSPTPPWSSIRELQTAVHHFENDTESETVKQWLSILMAPGSSLGGARPKANIVDENNNLWIAKFPAKNDTINKGAWEFLAYKLAINAGIDMAESKAERVLGNYHTFFTKRFDRQQKERIHFVSAMTMTGNNEAILKDEPASYLDIAEFIQNHCKNVDKNLAQLWRRIVFNIAISNTDDHLRNHGFIIDNNEWELSPGYDLNPSIDKDGLALNIDMDQNALDFELAKSVGEYFRLGKKDMNLILDEVLEAVSHWKAVAKHIGISNQEINLMSKAFQV